jgi:hypothetical protein
LVLELTQGLNTHDVGERKPESLQKEEAEDSQVELPAFTRLDHNYKLTGQINVKEQNKQHVSLFTLIAKPGHVITIEPGLYFIDVLLNTLSQNQELAKFVDFDLLQNYKVN